MTTSWVTRDVIRPDEVLARVADPGDGAVLLFLGVVRDHNEGRPVDGLHYEAYEPMAAKVLGAIAEESRERFGVGSVVVGHRVGELQIGDVSVAIAVSSPHRAEAYDASRYVIEEIKKRLPVWKREQYRDGPSEWVKGHSIGTSEAPEAVKGAASR